VAASTCQRSAGTQELPRSGVGLNDLSGAPSNNAKRNQRGKIEDEDGDLVRRHAAVMDSIKRLVGQIEPAPVDLAHETASENEQGEPGQQDCVIDDQRPEQEVGKELRIHHDLQEG